MDNPLIGSTRLETTQHCAEALSALYVLLADKHSDLCRLLSPIVSALDHAAQIDED